MASGIPKTLTGIETLGYEVRESAFVIHVDDERPLKKKRGYLVRGQETQILFEPTGNEKPTHMNLTGKTTVTGYIGDGEKQNDDDCKVFTVEIGVRIRYSTKKCDSTVAQIRRYKWYFDSHASLAMGIVLRDVLKDTPFQLPFMLQSVISDD